MGIGGRGGIVGEAGCGRRGMRGSCGEENTVIGLSGAKEKGSEERWGMNTSANGYEFSRWDGSMIDDDRNET